MNMQEEQKLIEKCQNGDFSAFSGLYDAYLSKIYRFVYYRVSHKETAEDLSSQVFLKALKAIGSADFSEKNFSAWLYKIAYNLLIDHYRGNKKDIDLEKAFNLSSDSDLMLDVDKKQRIETLKKAVNILSPKQRDIVIMRVWDELSYKEISVINGDSEDSCKVSFSRSLNKIKESLPLEYFILIFLLNILKTNF
ncbi:hypothetical protein CVU82_03840 [Candidatus Falkowbacteria bacterium HGW-Falkowbacteria-1]|jgi:RNA polymerase sigma-70 factor (ECF subfamily)|uniref:RNA polymerase subunit sigma-24 n=1 Tax=Candidatus Falkowbacteria bacterium HGW-Falkowbacteria-1 TaxID=2013768 RepID=A0A2N2E8X0_9BACT|nr:MAG: hypothetical protein CVU82_03840 [Candidatus Falkowbacteria bacterium HGW-Falkowbacteria-1]